MAINRRDIIEILREENELLKVRNHQISNRLARMQQAFRVLNEIEKKTRDVSPQVDLQALLHRLLELVMHACNTEHGSLILLDEQSRELEFVEVIGDTRQALKNHRIPLDTGVVGQVMKTGEAILLENVRSSRQWSDEVDDFLGFQTRALMCAPLVIEDQVIGTLEVVNQQTDLPFDNNDLNILRVAARFVSLVLERAEKLTMTLE